MVWWVLKNKPASCKFRCTLSLQSGTCQTGVDSCQVGLWSAPLPRARAEGGPRTYLRQQMTRAETYDDVRPGYGHTLVGTPLCLLQDTYTDTELN